MNLKPRRRVVPIFVLRFSMVHFNGKLGAAEVTTRPKARSEAKQPALKKQRKVCRRGIVYGNRLFDVWISRSPGGVLVRPPDRYVEFQSDDSSESEARRGFRHPDGVGDRFPLKSTDSTLESRISPVSIMVKILKYLCKFVISWR